MKLHLALPFLFMLVLFSCASAPKPEGKTAPVEEPAAPAPPPAPKPDSISGTVVSDEAGFGVPSHTEVRLLFGQKEVAHQAVDAEGNFHFEGPLSKGRYELAVRAGVLHGTRAFSFSGGEMKNVGIVIAKSDPRRRRRHRRHD